MMPIQEKYHITRESMEEILHQYFHPSREEAIANQKMLKEIRSHMSVSYEGMKKVVSYDNLDLSFLDKVDSYMFARLDKELYSTLLDVEIDMIIEYDFSGENDTTLSAA